MSIIHFIASVGTDQNQNTAAQADIAAFSPAIPTSLKLKIMIFKKGTAFFVNLLRILREILLR